MTVLNAHFQIVLVLQSTTIVYSGTFLFWDTTIKARGGLIAQGEYLLSGIYLSVIQAVTMCFLQFIELTELEKRLIGEFYIYMSIIK